MLKTAATASFKETTVRSLSHGNPRLSTLLRNASIVALGAFTVAGCAGGHGGGAQAAGRPPTPVLTATISRGAIDDITVLDGQVVPFLQASIATQSSGTVLKVYANQGDHVKAGQMLAKIDDAPLQAQLVQQVGSQYQATAKLSQSQIQQPITDQTSVSALSEAQEALGQARKQLLADEAAVRQNELTATADKKLLGEGFVSATTQAQADSAYIASEQTLSIDRSRVSQADAALRAARRNLLNIKLQNQVVAEQKGAVVQANGNTQLLRTQIGETILTAPFDAVVTQRVLDPGAYAGPQQPIFSLAQINPCYITFNVKDSDLPYVHQGTPVTFKSSAVPNRIFHGRVDVINVVPTTGTLLYPARLTVSNPDEVLRGGMLVNVSVTRRHVTNTLLAPSLAVSQEANGAAIYEVVGTGQQLTAKRVPVTVGIAQGDQLQVSGSAIHEGMKIVAAKPDTLQDGGPIAVGPPPGAPPAAH